MPDYKIIKTPYDYDNIEFIGTPYKGDGYIGKDKKIGLIRCPMCGRENYAMCVTSGQCAWCEFNVHNI